MEKCKFDNLSCECNIGGSCMVQSYNNKNITYHMACGDKYFLKNLEDITIDCLDKVFFKDVVSNQINNTLDWYHEEGIRESIVTILVDCHHGTDIPRIICEQFGILACLDQYEEGYFDTFTDVEDKLNEFLNKWIETDYYISLGYSDNGDYVLMVTDSTENLED